MILVTIKNNLLLILQAFIKTAAKILQNIQDGVFDVSNEVTIYSQFNVNRCAKLVVMIALVPCHTWLGL